MSQIKTYQNVGICDLETKGMNFNIMETLKLTLEALGSIVRAICKAFETNVRNFG